MLNYGPPLNWVPARADCRLDLTFQELRRLIERDVHEFNKLPTHSRANRTFRIASDNTGTRVEQVTEGRDNQPHVIFTMSTAAIRVNGGGVQFYVKPRWTGSTCDLFVNDNDGPYKVWEISQMALSNLFFGQFPGSAEAEAP